MSHFLSVELDTEWLWWWRAALSLDISLGFFNDAIDCIWLYLAYYETDFSLEYPLPQQQGTLFTIWDVFRNKITPKGVSLRQMSVGENCHTKAIGCVQFSCHPVLFRYPVILIQTPVSTFCLYCKPFRTETSHLSWYHSSGWRCKIYQH